MDLAKVPLGDGYTPHEASHHDLNPSFTQPMRWFSDEESQSTDGEGFPDETEVRTREGHGQLVEHTTLEQARASFRALFAG